MIKKSISIKPNIEGNTPKLKEMVYSYTFTRRLGF